MKTEGPNFTRDLRGDGVLCCLKKDKILRESLFVDDIETFTTMSHMMLVVMEWCLFALFLLLGLLFCQKHFKTREKLVSC